ncbi:RHS repeat domain-containing protein, partial [Burkholderia cepacia]
KGLPGQTGGGNRLLVRHYRYDASGQLTNINDTRRGQLAYRYDPVGRLLEAQSRLGLETFDFDPASNLIDPAEQREAERQHMPRIKALDNLLKQYAGTHYQYDVRGNQTKRWKNGQESRFTWDLFDRLTHYEDERLAVDYTYDALGRRLSKHSQAHYEERREAGPHWNRGERVKRNRELQCGFTLYGWDGDTLAWESKIADENGFGARTTHYVYEPGRFVPVVQAVRQDAILLHDQPEYGDYYRRDEDPLWMPPPPAPAIDSLAWYQCDHLGTPQELTDEQSEIAWSAEYRAWGAVTEVIRKASDGRVEVRNPIRFQGQYHDHESGLHFNRHRYYDSEVGRFVSKDPIGYAGGVNIYGYANGNPVSNVDLLGLAACTVLFPDYPIEYANGKTSTWLGGHGGILSYSSTGVTQYYEYGRYNPNMPGVIGEKLPADAGNVRRIGVPNLSIGEGGLPTEESLSKIKDALSKKAGKNTRVELKCDAGADDKKVAAYANSIAGDSKRKEYSWKPWSANHCRTFAADALKSGME